MRLPGPQADPTEVRLAVLVLAHHVVAAPVLFYRHVALGALLQGTVSLKANSSPPKGPFQSSKDSSPEAILKFFIPLCFIRKPEYAGGIPARRAIAPAVCASLRGKKFKHFPTNGVLGFSQSSRNPSPKAFQKYFFFFV